MFHYQTSSRSFFLKQYHPRSRGLFFSVLVFGALIGVILFAYTSFANNVTDTKTLRLVAIIHRHGDRTPTKLYKKDPYANWMKYFPLGLGQLTLKGKQQMYTLGTTLRERYFYYISKFTVQTVRVQSSDIERCIMSVGALLAAMFPPTADQIWSDELKWQPIPVHTIPRKYDNIFTMKAPCPRYKIEYDKVIQQSILNATKDEKELFKYLTDKTGMAVKSVREIETLYSTLNIEDHQGYPLPEWTESVFPEQMREKAALSMSLFAYNTILKRLRAGPLVNELMEYFENKTKDHHNDDDLKLLIYSGHDIGMVCLWRAFGFEELLLPDFGATLILELHRLDEGHFVKMSYLNSTSQTKPYELQIPKCANPCPLEELLELTEPVRPDNWEKECTEEST